MNHSFTLEQTDELQFGQHAMTVSIDKGCLLSHSLTQLSPYSFFRSFSKQNANSNANANSNSNNNRRNSPGPGPKSSGGASSGGKNAWAKPLQTKMGAPPPPGFKSKASNNNNNNNNNNHKSSNNNHKKQVNPDHELKHRDRSLHTFVALIGHKVQCHLTSGLVLEGILSTATPFASTKQQQPSKQTHAHPSLVYLLKRVRVVEGKDLPAAKDIAMGATVTLPMDQVAQLHAPQVKLSSIFATLSNTPSTSQNPNSTITEQMKQQSKGRAFTTDTEISKGASAGQGPLQAAGAAWTSGRAANSRAAALAGNNHKHNTNNNNTTPSTTGGLQGSIGTWDQFQANEELFNVQASFDENMYTTELDKSALDSSKIQRAEQLAKEIEGTASSNIHVQQERNQSTAQDYDEEDLHSGVLREKEARKTTGTKATTTTTAPKTMNYAKAAAAQSEKTTTTTTATPATVEEEAPTPKEEVVTISKKEDTPPEAEKTTPAAVTPERDTDEDEAPAAAKEEETKDASPAETEPKATAEKKASSKLNANAKSFTLNINAKTFTPSFGGSSEPPSMPPPQYDNTMMHQYNAPHMGQHHGTSNEGCCTCVI